MGIIQNWNWAGETRFSDNAAQQVVVEQNVDGRLEIFYIGTNGGLFHNWQTGPNADWHGEAPFSGDSAQQITVARNANGCLEMFYVGTNSDLYHNWQVSPGGEWAGEFEFVGDSAQQIAVGKNSDGRLEMFYVGTNGDLYHNWQISPGGEWAGEFEFVGDSAQQVTVGQNKSGRLEIFYVGTNNKLYHNWQVPNAGWAGEFQFVGNSARQIAVAQNADGRLEIFYVGTDFGLYHNWQISPDGPWAGETRFAGCSALQVAVGQNLDGRLEIFYVGLDNALFHNWQIAPNGAWAGEFAFPNVSALQVAVGTNADGRLEIVYVGTNGGLYHDWQNVPADGWVSGNGSTVGAPNAGLGSNSNYILASSCNALTDVAATVFVSEDMVLQSNAAPQGGAALSGFSFQLNCYSPAPAIAVSQQYVIGVFGSKVICSINNWRSPTQVVANYSNDLCTLSGNVLPAGYQLRIVLQNDSRGNITGASFSIADSHGGDLGNSTIQLGSLFTLISGDLSPIVAFQLNLVGPGFGNSATFSSGAGEFSYTASSILSVLSAPPVCAEFGYVTVETANTFYGQMNAGPSNYFLQPFTIATARPAIVGHGIPRPSPMSSVRAHHKP